VEVDDKNKFSLYGYLAGYLSCTFGHRTGVFVNMTDDEVLEGKNRHRRLAEEAALNGEAAEEGYLIHVSVSIIRLSGDMPLQ